MPVPASLHPVPDLRWSDIPAPNTLQYTERFSEAFLDSLRSKGDPLADDVIAELAETMPLTDVGDLLAEVRRRVGTSPACAAFIKAGVRLPAWVDFEAMRAGQRLIAQFPLHMGLGLFSGSLVGGAVFPKMALVTAMTGMLSGDTNKRLDETAAMVLRMSMPGTLEPGGEAHELFVRVRLLHGALRRFLPETGRFRHPTEVPINQQDLAITLGLFGYVNVRSLARMNIHLTEEERASFTLLWRYAGFVLGIDDALLPHTAEEQREFFLASLKHQARPEKLSDKNRIVMDNFARQVHRTLPPVSETVMRDLLYQICRYLSGDDYVTGMNLPNPGDDYWGLRLLRGLGSAAHFIHRKVPGGEDALYRFGVVHYQRSLRLMEHKKDKQGTYRVRTTQDAFPTAPAVA